MTDVTFWRVEDRIHVRVFPAIPKKTRTFPRCKDFLKSWKIALALSDVSVQFSRRILNGSGIGRRSYGNAGRFSSDVQKPPENGAGRINGISYAARHVYNCHTRGQQSHGGRAWPIMAGVRRAPRILDRHM